MMRRAKWAWAVWAGACALALPVAAQQANEDAAADVGTISPDMQVLFLTTEQRRVLEAVRQELVDVDVLESEDFVPVVLREQALGSEEELFPDRIQPLNIDAIIKRHSDSKSFVFINGQLYDVEKDKRFLEKINKLVVSNQDVDGSAIEGVDKNSKRKFRISVGQTITNRGDVLERLPVIIVKN